MTSVVLFSAYVSKEPIDQDQMAAIALSKLWAKYKSDQAKKGVKVIQEEFAKRLGWKQSTFSGYLRGSTPIGLQALISLSNELNCDPCDIRVELTPKNKIDSNTREIAKLNGKVVDLENQLKQEVQNLRDRMEALINSGNLNMESAEEAISLIKSLT